MAEDVYPREGKAKMRKTFVSLVVVSALSSSLLAWDLGSLFGGGSSSSNETSTEQTSDGQDKQAKPTKQAVQAPAATQTTKDANGLEHCPQTIGTLAIYEDTTEDWYRYLTTDMRLTSTVPVLKMLAQKTNCFVVVERGKTMRNMAQERALAASGELRSTSKMHKGQMVAADYTLSPSITFSERGTGGIGAVVGSLVSAKLGSSLGSAVAGNITSNDASVMLSLVDNRSGVQLMSTEGSSKSFDFSGTVLFGGATGGVIGGYSKTPQGKALVSAFVDAMNGIVANVRTYKAQRVKGGLGAGGNLQVQQD